MVWARIVSLWSSITVFVLFTVAQVGAQVIDSKRGFADNGDNSTSSPYSRLQAVDAQWYYNWSPTPSSIGAYDASFYPMFWNGGEVSSNLSSVEALKPAYVFGFNEPENSDQANMTVAQAISSWTSIANGFAGTSTKLISPAVSDDTNGRNWLASFMSTAKTDGLRVDAVAFHWYGVSTPTDPAAAAASFLGSVDLYHNTYNLPVFVTEFAIHDWGNAYTDQQIIAANEQFLNIVIPGLESRSYVLGYSWFNWFSDSPLYSTTSGTLTPTEMGYSYIGAVGNNTTSDISGQNLGEHVADLSGGTLTMTTSAATVKYIDALANNSTITGTLNWGLAGSGNWVRIQSGATLTKSGTNQITFSGGTVTNNGVLQVSQGTLVLGSPVTGSGTINVRVGGTLNISGMPGGFSVGSGQTLNVDGSNVGAVTANAGATISGGGILSGNLVAESGSTIQVGKNGSGVASRMLIDNFDSYAVGNVLNVANPPWTSHDNTTLAAIQSFNGSNVLTYGQASGSAGTSRPLPQAAIIDNNSTATFFFQIASKTNNPNNSFGLGAQASTGAVNYADYATQLRMKQDTHSTFAIDAVNGGAFSSTLASGLALNTWYNIWMVVNQPNDTYDLYMNTGTGAATTANKLNSTPLAFRSGTNSDLNEILALASNAAVDEAAMIDNLYYQSGVDLSNPILNFNPGLVWTPATLTVNGNYTQNAGATLALNLFDSTHHDMLQVSGNASLSGTLNVTFAINAPNPHIGDVYKLVSAGSISGSFSTLQLPTLSAGLAWDASRLSATGSLSIFSGLLGDFTQDGHVDNADLKAILLALTNRTTYENQYGVDDFELQTFGDVNGDGKFTNADLQTLLDLLNSGGGSADPVPEPASWVLAFLALAMVSGTRLCVRYVGEPSVFSE